MDKHLEKYLIMGLVMILLLLSLSGCGVKNIPVKTPEEKTEVLKQPTELETIGRLEGIAFVLGCMFDPTPCQQKKELQKTEDAKQ
jgi:predicted small lipoprotein YifL|tara:strand:- start:1166 stop:1420 length:255 start_codon:yes stop_codon:yes gene_type:complete